MQNKCINWQDPLNIASYLEKRYDDIVFLYSGLKTSYSGRYSYIAFNIDKLISSWEGLETELANSSQEFPNIFGNIAYEAGWESQDLSSSKIQESFIKTPLFLMAKFKNILRFDHEKKEILANFKPEFIVNIDIKNSSTKVKYIQSNMNDDRYFSIINDCLEQIKAGEFYQANITRKFYGEFSAPPNNFQIFKDLCKISPAPYSAFIRINNINIISSSPEMFIKCEDNKISARPIKGTASLKYSSDDLQKSTKDRAENLMIVDLMRNDISRSSIVGSVKVDSLYDIDSFSTLHHMSSNIYAKKLPDISVISMVKNAFPPASMTGTPKRRAMQYCASTEKIKRGIYSGTIGWFAKDSCELSVVIRTIIIEENKFEFQIGGGIIADSTAENELQEIFTKANAIAKTLNINLKNFSAIANF